MLDVRPQAISANQIAAGSAAGALVLSGERLDQLMTLEIRPLRGGLPAGIVAPIYKAARRLQGSPLSTLAAQRLCETVGQGDRVILVTGAGVSPALPAGETDGPPGATVLARAIALAFDASVTLVTQREHLPPIEACVAAMAKHPGGNEVSIECFPCGAGAARSFAADLFARLSPSVIIFVERDGPNEAGHYHGMRGNRRPPESVAETHHIAFEAKARGVLTIGIGDGGNEIGFGLIRSELTRILPNGGRSIPDETGMPTVVATDVLVSASVSNWGAYAIAAALSVAQGKRLLHSSSMELEMIAACVAAGARDGATSFPICAVDGIDAQGHASVVDLMQRIVDAALSDIHPDQPAADLPPEHGQRSLGVLGDLDDAQSRGGFL